MFYNLAARSDINQPVQQQKKVRNFGFNKKRGCTFCVAKTKELISCAFAAQLMICLFCFCICENPVFSSCSSNIPFKSKPQISLS